MDQEPARAFPDPWHDPDFSPRQIVGHKPERGSTAGGSWNDQGGRQRSGRLQVRTWVVSLVLLALWPGLLLDPMVGPLILGVLMAFGLTLALIVGTMGLGIMGFGLFAAGDHVIAWLRQGSRWPEH
ncbi:MAG: hypothetical protein ACLQU5_08170 [Isosphaeraceae bacterium]